MQKILQIAEKVFPSLDLGSTSKHKGNGEVVDLFYSEFSEMKLSVVSTDTNMLQFDKDTVTLS